MLRLEGLHTYYGRGHILQGVDLEVATGEIAAVLGRNGVGKTTTLRSIIGLARPQAGRVLLAGEDVAGWAPHRIVRLGVGYVPEGRMIFPELTVVENLQVAQRVPARQWTLERLFELFPSLAERRRSKGAQLSGGEQQMLAVARALVTDPRIMLLDEPSQGLAPLVVEELLRLHHAGERTAAGELGVAVLVAEFRLGRAFHHRHDALGARRGRVHAEHAHAVLHRTLAERPGEGREARVGGAAADVFEARVFGRHADHVENHPGPARLHARVQQTAEVDVGEQLQLPRVAPLFLVERL